MIAQMSSPVHERSDATRHVAQTARDAMSTLGNYFAFQELIQGNLSLSLLAPHLLLLLLVVVVVLM